MLKEYLGLSRALGIRSLSCIDPRTLLARTLASRTLVRDSCTIQTFKMTRMSKPIRQNYSSVQIYYQLLLWLKTANRQWPNAQATAQAKRTAGIFAACTAAFALPLSRFSALFCNFTEFALRRFGRQVNGVQCVSSNRSKEADLNPKKSNQEIILDNSLKARLGNIPFQTERLKNMMNA